MNKVTWCLEQGDCLEVLRRMPDACVDAVVTDPPAGIEFMGKEWDSFSKKDNTASGRQTSSWGSMSDDKKNPYASGATPRYRGKTNESLQGFQDFICEVFTEVYRVLKPGGHAVVWAIPRTSHHTAMGLERAGFDIRDNGTYLFHVFGQGFPKSHNVGLSIDKMHGHGNRGRAIPTASTYQACDTERENKLTSNPVEPYQGKTEAGRKYAGFGTALKPAYEAWLCCTKPLPLEAECLTLLLDVATDIFSEVMWQKSNVSASAADAGLRCFLPHYARAAASIVHGLVRTPSSVSSELARLVGKTFTHSDLESSEASQRIAAESAAILLGADPALTMVTGLADASFAAMATFASGSAGVATPWSIALSWSNILVDLFALTRTCIIETKTDPTIALRTLKSALTLVTSESTTQTNETLTSGDTSLVIAVDALLRSAQTKLRLLVTTTAPAFATTHTPQQTKAANGTQILVQGKPTVLSPDVEFWLLARKPLEGTIAENVLTHGTGALNIDGCRIGFQSDEDKASAKPQGRATAKVGALAGGVQNDAERSEFQANQSSIGRWPAHLILDEGAAALLDEQSGPKSASFLRNRTDGARVFNNDGKPTNYTSQKIEAPETPGGASRFFYIAKASKRDKDEGLDDFATATPGEKTDREDGRAGITPYAGSRGPSKNTHPTVKPTDLMRWLCRLVTPPGGIVLDPFAGSGSTGKAALLEGFSFIGIEREAEYLEIATARLRHADAICEGKADDRDD